LIDRYPAATGIATRLSKLSCRTPDQADAEDEHADAQQHCADIGEID
jgi:hypothetical protein